MAGREAQRRKMTKEQRAVDILSAIHAYVHIESINAVRANDMPTYYAFSDARQIVFGKFEEAYAEMAGSEKLQGVR